VANIEDLVNMESEAGVIASVICKPDFLLFSENLKSHHFSDTANGALYEAIYSLYEGGIERIDSFNLISAINRNPKIKATVSKEFDEESIKDIVRSSSVIARDEKNDFEILVKSVLDLSYRRELYKKLNSFTKKCLDEKLTVEDLTKELNDTVDQSILSYVIYEEPPLLCDIIDDLWVKTQSKRKEDGTYGYPSVIPQFGDYFTYEPSELVLYSAKPKKGKSLLLLNEAVNFAKTHGLKVFYVDSELTTEVFYIRIMSHLTGIPVKNLKSGDFSDLTDSEQKSVEVNIRSALSIIRKLNIRHVYKPDFDKNWLLTVVKKLKKENKIDVFIFDYFKGAATKGDDASSVYLGLGKAIDFVKNDIVGKLGLIGVAACQSNRDGEVADSINLERSCSTLVFIESKTNRDVSTDGEECGNIKFRVSANRNGGQMDRSDWIDADFDGDRCTFYACTQHANDEAI